MAVFRYLILFFLLSFLRFLLILVSIEKIYPTLTQRLTAIPNIPKVVKNTGLRVRRIFSSFLWKCGHAQSVVFDILLS